MEFFDIANKLKKIRMSLGWTQRQLAEKMGVPQSTITRVESGELNISASTLAKFCEATGYEFQLVNKEKNLVFEVADFVLDYCKKHLGEDFDVSNMKLNKLLYFVYKEYLEKFKNSTTLFKNDFRAWEHGPVYPAIYHKYNDFKNLPINLEKFNYSSLSPEQSQTIETILEKYYKKSAFELRNESHDSLWQKARDKGENEIIAI
jgi:uncharacterized phage-associated protein/DNA-binding Xre family transcriptional regulator